MQTENETVAITKEEFDAAQPAVEILTDEQQAEEQNPNTTEVVSTNDTEVVESAPIGVDGPSA